SSDSRTQESICACTAKLEANRHLAPLTFPCLERARPRLSETVSNSSGDVQPSGSPVKPSMERRGMKSPTPRVYRTFPPVAQLGQWTDFVNDCPLFGTRGFRDCHEISVSSYGTIRTNCIVPFSVERVGTNIYLCDLLF